MARIRTIKPEFFTSEDIVSLSPLARLVYIALWCEADKEGRFRWKPKTFKMRYMPAEDCDIESLCGEITLAKLVILYGDGLAYIPKFKTHQHINPRETASSLPDPLVTVLTRGPRVVTRQSHGTDAQVGREGKGREGDSSEPLQDSEPVTSFAIPLNDGTEWQVPEKVYGEWVETFPAVDVGQELREMRAWSNANAERRKTQRGVAKFAVSWLAKAQDNPGHKSFVKTQRESFV